ncbi:MAG TPA: type IV pilus assembly protein PilM [Patescibacteria group bacterium]|nr:type IV pilus assembly protein PilM [Patescibacteria group bacterium]
MFKIKKQIFGLDVSDHSIEALVLKKKWFGPPRVGAYARTILRGEIVKNGVIKNPQKLGESIKKLLASAQPKAIKTPNCILSLPESQVYSTIFKFPAGLKAKEIRNTIPLKAEEVIPFKSTDVYFDFKIIGKNAESQEVFYVAAPAKVVDAYFDVLKAIGLMPVAFDLESISLGRALLNDGKNEPALLMDIGSRTTNLNIFDQNGIRQSLTINVAGDRFTKSIAAKLNLDEKQADDLKMKSGFDPQKESGKILLILQNEFKRIVGETKKLIEYFNRRTKRKVLRVVLAGGSSLLPGLEQYLSENLGLAVKLGSPLAKIDDPAPLVKFKNKAVLFSNVVGLASRGLAKNPIRGDINLKPGEAKRFQFIPAKAEKKMWRKIYWRFGLLIFLILVLIAILFLRQMRVYPFASPELENQEAMISPDINLDILDELRSHFVVPTSTPAVDNSEKIRITSTIAGYINIRSGAGTSFTIIGQAVSSQIYEVISEATDWYQIKFSDDKAGWVAADLVEKLE